MLSVHGPYIQGQTFTLSWTVQSSTTGLLTDASSFTVRVLAPAGTVTTYVIASGQVSHDGTGLYSLQLTAGAPPTPLQQPWQYHADAPLPIASTPHGADQGTIITIADPTV